MKHTKKIIAIVTVILAATVLGSHAIMTSAVGINIFADFENGSGPFTALYGNASMLQARQKTRITCLAWILTEM